MHLADYKLRFGKAGWLINQSLTRETEIYVKDTTNPVKMWRILEEKRDSKDFFFFFFFLFFLFYSYCLQA